MTPTPSSSPGRAASDGIGAWRRVRRPGAALPAIYPWAARPQDIWDVVRKIDGALATLADIQRSLPQPHPDAGPALGDAREAMMVLRDAFAELAEVVDAESPRVEAARRAGDADAVRKALRSLARADGRCRRRVQAATAVLEARLGSRRPREPSSPGPVLRSVEEVRDRAYPSSLHRVVAVRETAATVSDSELRQLAVARPEVVGPLDGLPTWVRMLANRTLLRRELDVLAQQERRVEDALHAMPEGSKVGEVMARLRVALSSRDGLTAVWALPWDDPDTLRGDVRARIRLLLDLLHDRPQGQPRQVLLVSIGGRGRLIEAFGDLRAARHLAIVVPGTGTALRGFHQPSETAKALAGEPGVAAIAWMGADFPLAFANESPFRRYADSAAEPLRDFVEAVSEQGQRPHLSLVGHSYGGAIIGAAERAGILADTLVHVASAGAGPGVASVRDYPDTDPLGRPRVVRRYALVAPGDPIRWAHRVDVSRPWSLGPVPASWLAAAQRWVSPVDLGVDPSRLEGVENLQAGVWLVDRPGHRRGEPVAGASGHADVVMPGTTAFAEIRRVISTALGEN